MARINAKSYVVCPICGSQLLLSVLRSHVGRVRCIELFNKSGGKYRDATHGPVVREIAEQLDKVLFGSVVRKQSEVASV